jgi:uncharacterized Zn finger protein (UPF0148 family)
MAVRTFPRCWCGFYAVAECVICDEPLCDSHFRRWEDERVRCATHLEEVRVAQEAAEERARVEAEAERSRVEAQRELDRAAAAEKARHLRLEAEAKEAERRLREARLEQLAEAEAARVAPILERLSYVSVGPSTTNWIHCIFGSANIGAQVRTLCGVEERVVTGHHAFDECKICFGKTRTPSALIAAAEAAGIRTQ